MTAPNFGSNFLCGPSTVLQENGPTKRGPTRPPQEDTICSPGSPKRPKLAAWRILLGQGGARWTKNKPVKILGHERFPKRSPGGSCGAKGKKRTWGRARDDNKRGLVNFWERNDFKRRVGGHPPTKPPKTSTKGRLADVLRQNPQKRFQKDAWWTSPDKAPRNDYKRGSGGTPPRQNHKKEYKRTPGGRPQTKPPKTITKGRLVDIPG